jgi:hypothetical protein
MSAAGALALLKAMTVAVHFQDVNVMDQPVEQRAGQPPGSEQPVHSSNGRLEMTIVEPRS